MSQFENSEVWQNYAKSMQDKCGINKYAVTSRDITKTLALEGVVSGAIAGAGATGVIGGGATGLTGALTALIPVGSGAGASAAAGGLSASIASNPIGWIVGGVLLVGSVAAGIYFAVSKTDDNLDDLISRIEALDYKGTNAEGIVESWIRTLNAKRKVFQLPLTGAIDDKTKAEGLAQKSMELKNLLEYMEKDMQGWWPEVKKQLDDWQTFPFNDPADFEESFKKTFAEGKRMLKGIQQRAQAAAKGIIDSTKNPDALMKEINSLDTEITNVWGKPEYSPEETKALGVGIRIMRRQVNMKEYSDNLPMLSSIRDDLKRLLIQAKKKTKRAEIEAHPISKRAVKLPDQPTAPGVEAVPEKSISKRPGANIPRNDVVGELQRYLNHLKVTLQIPSTNLSIDSRYGPKTAEALTQTIIAINKDNERFLKWLQWQGVPVNRIHEIKFMNSQPEYITQITREMGRMAEAVRVGGPKAIREMNFGQQQAQPAKPSARRQVDMRDDIGSKQNPTREEMLAYFKGLHYNIDGSRVNVYDYARRNIRMSDNDIFNLLYNKYPGWAPKEWSLPNIVDALTEKEYPRKTIDALPKKEYPRKEGDILNRLDLTDVQILDIFKTLNATTGGGKVNLYDYAQQNLGKSDGSIVNILKNKYQNKNMPANKWSIPDIVRALGQKHSIF